MKNNTNHICPICGVEFSGEIWKTVCIDCYKDLQGDIPNEIFNDEIVSAVNRWKPCLKLLQ